MSEVQKGNVKILHGERGVLRYGLKPGAIVPQVSNVQIK